MKILRYTYMIVLAAVTAVMAACSSDSETPDQPNPEVLDGLTLRIATGMTTRARTTEWVDANAQDEEMMNLWVVVVTNTSDGTVQRCFVCRPSAGEEREIDEVGRVAKGAYTIYSFANISVNKVSELLGLTAPASLPTIDSTPTEITLTGTVSHTNVAAKVVTVNGNGFNPTAADNGFGESGIPMSNKQTTSETESQKDLIVVRMLAKIEVQLFNESPSNDIKVKSATLTKVTDNTANNLKLLPNYTTASSANNMEAVHGDILPNLNGTPTTVGYTYSLSSAVTVPANYDYDTNKGNSAYKLSFYVNESIAPTLDVPGLFFLTIGIEKTDGTIEYHHVLMNQKGSTTADNDKWGYIARNDYRIIPVVLTDWQFRVEPIAFVPIAGYPATLLSSDALTATFSTGGMIALQPFVKKIEDNSWRDFSNLSEDDISVSYVTKTGSENMLTIPFAYDNVNKCIIGELNNNLPAGTYMATVTVSVKLDTFSYSFSFNVVLQK